MRHRVDDRLFFFSGDKIVGISDNLYSLCTRYVLPVELLEILAQLTEENILNLVREFALELLLDQLQI